MPTKFLNLYHVTTYTAAGQILDHGGIDPKFSEGRNKWCWYVTKRAVTWAISHVMHRHQVLLEEVAILSVRAPYIEVWKTSRTSVYATRETFLPTEMVSATMWLSREEKYLVVRGKGTRGHRWNGAWPRGKEGLP